MNVRELEDLRVGAKLASSLPEITAEIEGMRSTVMVKAFNKISNGVLTPDEALSYWMELYSYSRLQKRFETKAAIADRVTETRRMTNGEA